MSAETTPAPDSTRTRPAWATTLAAAVLLLGLVFFGLFGLYGQGFKSGRLVMIVPMWAATIGLLGAACIAWAFWTMRPFAGRLLTTLMWLALVGSFAHFLWGSKPTPGEIGQVSLFWYLPWAILAAALSVYIARKRETFDRWAEK